LKSRELYFQSDRGSGRFDFRASTVISRTRAPGRPLMMTPLPRPKAFPDNGRFPSITGPSLDRAVGNLVVIGDRKDILLALIGAESPVR